MDWGRWFRHLFATRGDLNRAFPPPTLATIEAAITESESSHSCELRFAIETSLEPADALHGKTPRARALEVFAALGVWDTEANNGVLVYLLLADRDVEIVADRGFNARVTQAEWSAICDAMEARFHSGQFESGALTGVRLVGELAARHFPLRPGERNANELPNRPALL